MQRPLLPDAVVFRPLLKWPGGKGREWRELAPLLPRDVRDFVDPFLGGGAPFARTPFAGHAYLNDRHERLVALHRLVQAQDASLLSAIEELGVAWEALRGVAASIAPSFARQVAAHRSGGQPPAEGLRKATANAARRARLSKYASAMALSVIDKARRVARLEKRHDVSFDVDQIDTHCETGVRAGFYTFVRAREQRGVGPQAVADFVFIRQFCYGSMFRHNAKGEFNIPYGGTSYNRKSLLSRLKQYVAPGTRAALERATFSCEDFEHFLERLAPTLGPTDFVFADPPYDSEFKSYGPLPFGRDDHHRLAASLSKLPCPWLLVIKETDFVRSTYLSKSMRVHGARELSAFGKKYGYNVRGRNERRVRHLAIGNYAPAAPRDHVNGANPRRA